jgi:hypothetical protein
VGGLSGVGEPDPGTAGTSAEFVVRLNELRVWAGKPSLRRLQRLAGQTEAVTGERVDALPPSTSSYVLTGKVLPKVPRLGVRGGVRLGLSGGVWGAG